MAGVLSPQQRTDRHRSSVISVRSSGNDLADQASVILGEEQAPIGHRCDAARSAFWGRNVVFTDHSKFMPWSWWSIHKRASSDILRLWPLPVSSARSPRRLRRLALATRKRRQRAARATPPSEGSERLSGAGIGWGIGGRRRRYRRRRRRGRRRLYQRGLERRVSNFSPEFTLVRVGSGRLHRRLRHLVPRRSRAAGSGAALLMLSGCHKPSPRTPTATPARPGRQRRRRQKRRRTRARCWCPRDAAATVVGSVGLPSAVY